MTARIAFSTDTNYRGVDNVIPSIVNQGEPWRIIATFDSALGNTTFSGNISTKEGTVFPFQFRNFTTNVIAQTSQVEIFIDASVTSQFSTKFLRNGSIFLDSTQYFEIPYIEVNQNDLSGTGTILPGTGDAIYNSAPEYQINVTSLTPDPSVVDFLIRNKGETGDPGPDGATANEVVAVLETKTEFLTDVANLVDTSGIAINAGNITTNAGNIASNSNKNVINTANITTNTENISTNTSNIATNTVNIATNTGEISDNAAAILVNDGDIAALQTGKQNTLTDTDVDRIKSSALPQNTITSLATLQTGKQNILINTDLSKIKSINLPTNTASAIGDLQTGKQNLLSSSVFDKIQLLPGNTSTALAGKQERLDDIDFGTVARINSSKLPNDTKTELDDIDTAIALKASTTTVNTALALKANTSTVNTALALKADTTTVNTALALKANSADVTTSLASNVTASNTYADQVETDANTYTDEEIAKIEAIPVSPFHGFTITGSPDSTDSVPKWTSATTLEWSADNSSAGTTLDAATLLRINTAQLPDDTKDEFVTTNANVTANTTAIGLNTTARTTNATNIATNTSGIATNVTNIATNATAIATKQATLSDISFTSIPSTDAELFNSIGNLATSSTLEYKENGDLDYVTIISNGISYKKDLVEDEANGGRLDYVTLVGTGLALKKQLNYTDDVLTSTSVATFTP